MDRRKNRKTKFQQDFESYSQIVGTGLLIFATYLILVSDQGQPLLTFIRTFSKFYRTFFFQGVRQNNINHLEINNCYQFQIGYWLSNLL
jgi:hypothetical protein